MRLCAMVGQRYLVKMEILEVGQSLLLDPGQSHFGHDAGRTGRNEFDRGHDYFGGLTWKRRFAGEKIAGWSYGLGLVSLMN